VRFVATFILVEGEKQCKRKQKKKRVQEEEEEDYERKNEIPCLLDFFLRCFGGCCCWRAVCRWW
jgi:hypothetical protein